MDEIGTSVVTPAMQWGFAGFAFLLLVILIWVLKKHWEVYAKTMDVISHNSQVIESAAEQQSHSHDLLRDIHSILLTRRCVAKDAPKD